MPCLLLCLHISLKLLSHGKQKEKSPELTFAENVYKKIIPFDTQFQSALKDLNISGQFALNSESAKRVQETPLISPKNEVSRGKLNFYFTVTRCYMLAR